jgi:DNA-binding NarL/FixJ family response regulator
LNSIRIFLCQLAHHQKVLSFFFDNTGGFQVVGACEGIAELETQLHTTQPGIVLLDISLEKGMDMLGRIKRYASSIKVIILTDAHEPSCVLKCLKAGADGYLLTGKTTAPRLIDYIRDAHEGGTPISPKVMKDILGALPFNSTALAPLVTLTKRETEIMQLMVKGLTYKSISFNLNIALDTVRSHIRNIYEKLEVNSKSEAVVKALKERIAIA